jgi:hypothetical protein
LSQLVSEAFFLNDFIQPLDDNFSSWEESQAFGEMRLGQMLAALSVGCV